jgi:hypothetical protein
MDGWRRAQTTPLLVVDVEGADGGECDEDEGVERRVL